MPKPPSRRAVLQTLAGSAAAFTLPAGLLSARALSGDHALAAATPLPPLPPRARGSGAQTFVALGDWGRNGSRRQYEVGQAMAGAAGRMESQFVLSMGDNFYPAGVSSVDDPKWRSSFERVYAQPALQVPWYVALGNHDYRGDPRAQIAYTARSDRWRMPSAYYAVPGAALGIPEMDLFVLDTSPMLPMRPELLAQVIRGRLPPHECGAQLAWFEEALAQSRAPWKVVIGHHPIHSGGHHGDARELIAHVKPLLERYGVQAYLSGHDHVLQHIRNGSVDYVVTGAGASAGDVTDVPGSRFKASREGFAAFEVAGDVMRLEFLDFTGVSLYRTELPRRRV